MKLHKVLFFCAPWTEVERPGFKNAWIKNFFEPLSKTIKDINSDCEIYLICGWAQKYFIDDSNLEHCFHSINVIEVAPEVDTLKLAISVQENDLNYLMTVNTISKITEFAVGLSPDLIVSFITPIKFLTSLLPTTPSIICEAGFSFRPPFISTFYADDNGSFSNSHLANQADQIKSYSATPIELDLIHKFKKLYRDTIISKIPDEIRSAFSSINFSKKILLPLQFSNYFGWHCCTSLVSQLDFLEYVLSIIPPEIAVIPTEHHDYWPRITLENKYLISKKYPNCIWLDAIQEYESPSTLAAPFVDGIITVSSSSSYLSLLFDIPSFVVGDSHLKLISTTINELNVENLSSVNSPNRDNILVYLMTRYFVPANSTYFFSKSWLKNFLVNLKSRGTLYPPIADSNDIINYHIDNILELEFPQKASIHDERVKMYKERCHYLDNANSKLNKEIKQLTDRNCELDDITKRQLDLITNLTSTKIELEKCKEQNVELERLITSMLNSNSWKITKPIRWVFDRLRN